jgi:hypothetical protein
MIDYHFPVVPTAFLNFWQSWNNSLFLFASSGLEMIVLFFCGDMELSPAFTKAVLPINSP